MGGDTEIRKLLRQTVPEAFIDESLVMSDEDGQWAILEDTLTRLHHTRGPRFDFTFTLEELLFFVLEHHMKPLREGRVSFAVICGDDPARVPVEKAETQAERTEAFRAGKRARNAPRQLVDGKEDTGGLEHDHERDGTEAPQLLPYPDDAALCDEGIQYRDFPEAEGGTLRSERVHIGRLLHTRQVRVQIWDRLLDLLKSGKVEIPGGTSLVLDHFAEGPWELRDSRLVRRDDLKHPYGEGEMMCVFWASHLRRSHNVLIESIDTDMMPLIIHHVSMLDEGPRKKLLWRYWHTGYVDIHELHTGIYTKMGWNSLDFMVAFILCGTDYFKKKTLFPRVGCKLILHGVQACSNHVAHLYDDQGHFNMIARFIYNDFMTPAGARRGTATNSSGSLKTYEAPPSLPVLRVVARRKAYKEFNVATDKELANAYATLLWHLNYWLTDPESVPLWSPVPYKPPKTAPVRPIPPATFRSRRPEAPASHTPASAPPPMEPPAQSASAPRAPQRVVQPPPALL